MSEDTALPDLLLKYPCEKIEEQSPSGAVRDALDDMRDALLNRLIVR